MIKARPRGQKLSDIIYWDILQQIRTGRFEPDQRLPSEMELCEQFDVSRPIVREALRRLRDDGLIYSRRGAGSFIRGTNSSSSRGAAEREPLRLVQSIADVHNVYEFRIAFEGEMAFAAASSADDETIKEMQLALDKMEQALKRGEAALEEDVAFHMAVARATQNQFFVEVLRMMQPHLRFVMELVMKLSIVDPEEHSVAVQTQHAAVFDRIQARDPDGARQAMRTLIANARNRVFHGIEGANVARGRRDVELFQSRVLPVRPASALE